MSARMPALQHRPKTETPRLEPGRNSNQKQYTGMIRDLSREMLVTG